MAPRRCLRPGASRESESCRPHFTPMEKPSRRDWHHPPPIRDLVLLA